MTFMENELRKIFESCTKLSDIKFIGNACYGSLSDTLRMKAQFIAASITGHYDALKVTILNRTQGVVDTLIIHLADVWDKAPSKPYIWEEMTGMNWYMWKPDAVHYMYLTTAVSSYLMVFHDPSYMREGRYMELLNSVIDHVSVSRNTRETIHELLLMGFAADELKDIFNFAEDDVAEAAEEFEKE